MSIFVCLLLFLYDVIESEYYLCGHIGHTGLHTGSNLHYVKESKLDESWLKGKRSEADFFQTEVQLRGITKAQHDNAQQQ